MITKLFRNDFILKKEDYEKIEKYFRFHINIKNININRQYNFEGFKWLISICSDKSPNCGRILKVNIKCIDSFRNIIVNKDYVCYKIYELFLPKASKSIVSIKDNKEQIIFSYKIKTKDEIKDIDYFLKNIEYCIGYSLEHILSYFYYIDFNNDIELFAGLYSFVKHYAELYDILKEIKEDGIDGLEDYSDGIEFLRKKLEYFGYDSDYLSGVYKVANNVINNSVKTYEDVFKYFMYSTLHLLNCNGSYEDFRKPILPLEILKKLDILYDFYYNNLKSYKAIS